MNNFALIVAIVVGIVCLLSGLYVGLGRRSTATAGTTGGTTTTTTTGSFSVYPFWSKKWFWIVILIAAALAAIIYFWKDIAALPAPDLPTPAFLNTHISPVEMMVLGGLLLVISAFLKKPAKAMWLPNFLSLAGILFLAFGFLATPLGMEMRQGVEDFFNNTPQSMRLQSYQDDSLVSIPIGGSRSFIARRVIMQNAMDYCLDISPRGAFKIAVTSDARLVRITARSGEPERATVTSIPLGTHGCQ